MAIKSECGWMGLTFTTPLIGWIFLKYKTFVFVKIAKN